MSQLNDYTVVPIRGSAVLTTSYVAGNIIKPGIVQGVNLTPQNYNQMNILVDFTIGSLTTAEVKVDFSSELYYDLPYDGQSANFTVGKTVTGSKSGAKAVIVSDADSGTSGTLVVKSISGKFIDNEAITDDNSTPGAAVVNAANGVGESVESSVSDDNWYQETFSSVSTTTSTESLGFHQLSGSGRYRLEIPMKDVYVRISAKGTGTVTGSLMDITAQLGTT